MKQTATILAPGQGDKYFLVGDQITFKLTGDQTGGAYAFAENYCTPQHGPPPHVHHNEDECFYVVEGTMMFAHRDTAFVGGPGTAVYLKKDVLHTFKNVGQTPARFMMLATPAGFEKFTVAAGEAISAIPCGKTVGPADIERLLAIVPAYGIEIRPDWQPTAPPPAPRPDRKLWVWGLLVNIKLTGQETGGALSLAEVSARPGLGVPAHSHRAMDEVFYALEGEWEFTLAGQAHRVTRGGFVHVPRGTLHAFRNVGTGPAKLLDYHLPGGFDQFFEDAGTEAIDENNPPPAQPVDPEALRALLDKHGMDVPASPH